MNQLIVVNLTTRTSDWQPPVITFGESLTLSLRFNKTVDGNTVEPNLTIDSIAASAGLVDARPGGGTFALQFGADPSTDANTTAVINHDATPAQLIAAINALGFVTGTYGAATAKKVNGSWLLAFGTQAAEVPFKVVKNELWPICFGRVMARPIDAKWWHELRLVQAPVAFTSDKAIVLPPEPSVSEVRAGSATVPPVNELQQLYVPPTFRGAYTLKKGTYQRTPLLSPDMGPDDIQAALNTLGSGFTVTLPTSFHFLIEFIGDFAGQPFAALGVEVEQAPPGDLTFTLPFDRAELASLLRGVASVTLPLEVDIVAHEDGGDPFQITALVVPITIQRSLNFPELEELLTLNWLRFPSPKSYVPFGADNILTGEKIYACTVGNGALTTFVIAHDLDSEDVQVFVRQNISGGLQLVDGTDFTATIDLPNQVTVNALTGAPGAAAWRIMVVAAKEIASFADGLTVTIDQVIGLEARLEADEANIASLLSLLPGNASATNAGAGPTNAITIQLPPSNGVLFARDAQGNPITDLTKLPSRGAYMLPAIDKTSGIVALPTAPLPDPALNGLWSTAAAVLIPGGGHIRSGTSIAGGFVGSDGRMLAPYTRSGATDTYFPTPFELLLFDVNNKTGAIMINDQMFTSGTTLTLLFKLGLQLINANSDAQWVLVIEQAALTKDATGTVDYNLAEEDWGVATPLVKQPLYLSSALQTHGFGVTITNTAGVFTANGLIYKRIVSANANVLQTANFGLRARLINFDTVDAAAGTARGWVSWALQQPDNGTLGASIA